MTEYDGFRVERDPGRAVATITLDVPGKLNRVSMAARDQLSAVFAELDADEAVRFVVLTGAGGQFTAGGDIAGFMERSPWQVSQLARNVAAPERCSKPVIARLEGYVLGVGLELALACDFRIAADDVQLGLPEVTIGMIPGSGGTQRLARMVGLGRAKDLVMRGRRVRGGGGARARARHARRPGGELDAAVASLVDELSAHSPLALAMAKRVLEHRLRRAAPRRPRARGPRLRPPAADPRLPRGRGGVRREAPPRVHRRVISGHGERRLRPPGPAGRRRSSPRRAHGSSSPSLGASWPAGRRPEEDRPDHPRVGGVDRHDEDRAEDSP